MAMMKCEECGHEISDKAEFCPNCGYRMPKNETVNQKEETGNNDGWIRGSTPVQPVVQKKKKKVSKKLITGIIIFFLFCALVNSLSGSDDEQETNGTEVTNQSVEQPQENKKEEKEVASNGWEDKYKDKDIKYVDMDFLYKNAKYYKDNIVICCGKAYTVGDNEIQFDTNDGNFFIEITCSFENDVSSIQEKQNVCFVGKVGDTTSLLGTDTIKIDGCYIVATDSGVSDYQKMIKKNKGKQKKYVSEMKNKQKKKKETESKKEKKGYVKKCKTYKYKDIQRKPDSYKGKKIKVSGTVIQSTEGWFDGVMIRLEDSKRDVWYINYTYSKGEKKILENDKITIYGECTGTETYTTVIGSSVTIPSVDAVYIE